MECEAQPLTDVGQRVAGSKHGLVLKIGHTFGSVKLVRYGKSVLIGVAIHGDAYRAALDAFGDAVADGILDNRLQGETGQQNVLGVLGEWQLKPEPVTEARLFQ